MGKHMATNLMKGGYKLVIHDANRVPVKELAGLGAKEAFSPKEVGGRWTWSSPPSPMTES